MHLNSLIIGNIKRYEKMKTNRSDWRTRSAVALVVIFAWRDVASATITHKLSSQNTVKCASYAYICCVLIDVGRTAVSVYALCANNTDSYASVTSQRRRTMMSQFELEFQAREWHRSSEVICVWETSLETRDKDVNEWIHSNRYITKNATIAKTKAWSSSRH